MRSFNSKVIWPILCLALVISAVLVDRFFFRDATISSANNDLAPAKIDGQQANSSPPRSPGGLSRREPVQASDHRDPALVAKFTDDFDNVVNDRTIDTSTRLGLLSQLVMKIAEQGESGLALSLIRSNLGPGDYRNRLVQTCFRNSSFAESEKLYNNLEHDDEKASARQGIASSIARALTDKGHTFSFDRQQLAYLKENSEEVAGSAAIAVLDTVKRTNPENLDTSVQSVIESGFSPPTLDSIAGALSHRDPFSSWSILSSLPVDLTPRSGALVVEEMLRRDPQRSFDLLAASPGSAAYLTGATVKWLQSDANGPKKYLAENASSLSQEQADRIRVGVVEYALSIGEIASANEWAEQISDEKIRPKMPSPPESGSN